MSPYDTDFVKWAEEQAAHLLEGRFDLVDIANVAEEIESLSRSDKRALRQQIRRLLVHLLKMRYLYATMYPSGDRARSWEDAIHNARDEIAELIAESPSLAPTLAAIVSGEYPKAARDTQPDTNETLPDACPWTLTQMLDPDFFGV